MINRCTLVKKNIGAQTANKRVTCIYSFTSFTVQYLLSCVLKQEKRQRNEYCTHFKKKCMAKEPQVFEFPCLHFPQSFGVVLLHEGKRHT